MASTKFYQDACSYEEKLRRSVGPGMYMLNSPANDCGEDCRRDIPADPFLRFQSWGPQTCAPGSAVDDSSELLGLRYKNSKCAQDAYLPGKYSAKGACAVPGTANPRACLAPTESSRLSNPPCTLRSTGWNRWEWLCWNPQDRAIIPFEQNVSYRTVVKDNHVPCLETPLDQSVFLPESKPTDFDMDSKPWKSPCNDAKYTPGNPNAASWRSMKEISQM